MLLLVLIAVVSAQSGAKCIPPLYCFSWVVGGGMITFNFSARADGWVALGVSPTVEMPDGDMVVCFVDVNGSHVSDRSGTAGYLSPDVDASQDLTDLGAYKEDGHTYCSVSRLLDTGDTVGDVVISSSMFVLWALHTTAVPISSDGMLERHENSGSTLVEFFPPPPPPPLKWCTTARSFCIEWKVNTTAMTVEINMTATASGWIGLALTDSGGMWPADALLCWVDADSMAQVSDRSNVDYVVPEADAVQDLRAIAAWERDGKTSCTFERAIDTGDASDRAFVDGPMSIGWAYSRDKPASAGGPIGPHVSSGVGDLTFFDGVYTLPPPSPPPSSPPPPAVNECPGGGCPPGEWCTEDKRFCFQFHVTPPMVAFTVTARTSGWMALGFTGAAERMYPADVYVMSLDAGGTPRIMDGWNRDYRGPSADVQQSAQLTGSSREGDTLTFSFTRLLQTNDAEDVAVPNGPVDIIWAVGNEPFNFDNPASAQHQERSYSGAGEGINLFAGGMFIVESSQPAKHMLRAHGSLMFLAWVPLSLGGTFVARYLKDLGPLWFRLHVGAQLGALLLTFIAWCLAVAAVSKTHRRHFFGPSHGVHQMLGYFVCIVAVLQPLLGAYADRLWSATRAAIPVFPDKVHWGLGGGLHFFTLLNIVLGLVAIKAHPAVWVCALLSIVAVGVLFVWKQLVHGTSKHKEAMISDNGVHTGGDSSAGGAAHVHSHPARGAPPLTTTTPTTTTNDNAEPTKSLALVLRALGV